MKEERNISETHHYIRNSVVALQQHLPKLTIDLATLRHIAPIKSSIHKPIAYIEDKPPEFLQCLLKLRDYISNTSEPLKTELIVIISPLSVFLYHELRKRQNKEVYIEFLDKVVENKMLKSAEEVDNQYYFNTKHVLTLSQETYDHFIYFIQSQNWLDILSVLNQNFIIEIKHKPSTNASSSSSNSNPSKLRQACDLVDLGIGSIYFNFVKTVTVSSSSSVIHMTISTDNRYLLATTASSSFIYKWDLTKAESKHPNPQNGAVHLYRDEEFTFHIDPESREKSYVVLRGHSAVVYYADVHADNTHALSASYDGLVILWNIQLNSAICRYDGHSRWPVYHVRFSPVSPFFCSSSHDTTVKFWRTDKIEPLRMLCGHEAPVTMVTFHPNGSYVFGLSDNRDIRMWEVAKGNCVRVITTKHKVTNIIASPNGKHITCVLDSSTIQVIDIPTTKVLRSYDNAKLNNTHTLCYLHNNTIATGGTEGNVTLWDNRLHSKLHIKPIKEFKFEGRVHALSCSQGGLLMVALQK